MLVRADSLRQTKTRSGLGSLTQLRASLLRDGFRHPICAWSDGTVISGERRLVAAIMAGADTVPVEYVSTIEDAAKRLTEDNEDDYLTKPRTWSEVCELWEVLRRLDAPAAQQRRRANMQRGQELRRAVLAGKRKPGRASGRGQDYFLTVLAPPFGISDATARRIVCIHRAAKQMGPNSLAAELMQGVDLHKGAVWKSYQRLLGHNPDAPHAPAKPKLLPQLPSAAAAQQLQALSSAEAHMAGMLAGIRALGPLNPTLEWSTLAPHHAALSEIRRGVEKLIKEMKGRAQ